jgi:hypothetical protein
MLTQKDLKVLRIMSSNLLLTRTEIAYQILQDGLDGAEEVLRKLRDMELVQRVDSLGTSFVITSKGQKALKRA